MKTMFTIVLSIILTITNNYRTVAPQPGTQESQPPCEAWTPVEIHGEFEEAVFVDEDGFLVEYPIYEAWDAPESGIIFTVIIDGELQGFGWVE